jgi:hypothetical protein
MEIVHNLNIDVVGAFATAKEEWQFESGRIADFYDI